MPGASTKLSIPNRNIVKDINIYCQKPVCACMRRTDTVLTRVHWGEAKGHCSGGQIPLKWHLKQTSSDKVVPFLCP